VANRALNCLVEVDVAMFPEDFFEYHRRTRPPYDGVFPDIEESERPASLESCGSFLLRALPARKSAYSPALFLFFRQVTR
jgi:hypothetical protein